MLATGPAAAADDLTDRLMGYDANKDGRVTRDERPARMHNLAGRAERLGPPNGGPPGSAPPTPRRG